MRKILMVALLVALLGLIAAPAGAAAAQWQQGLRDPLQLATWAGACVNAYVDPAGCGTITGMPNGIDTTQEGGGWLLHIAVPGGNGFYTGQGPTLGSYYQYAPLNFWLTATPAAGYEFIGWSGTPVAWQQNNQVHIQYDKNWMDGCNGYIQVVAMFAATTITIDCRPAAGVVWDSPSGVRTLQTFGSTSMICHVSDAYADSYEFAGWIADWELLPVIDDVSDPVTVVYLDIGWIGKAHWIQPTIRLKAQETPYDITWAHSEGADGQCAHETMDTLLPGVKVHNWWESDNTSWVFQYWDCTNVGCSDIYSADGADFWLTGEADGQVVAIVVLSSETPTLVTLTMDIVGQGTTYPEQGDHEVTVGQLYTIRATAKSGWYLSQWMGLPNGLVSSSTSVQVMFLDDTTVTAIFVQSPNVGPPDGGDGSAAAMGLWSAVTTSLTSVGLGNTMGRALVVVCGMIIAYMAARKNKTMGALFAVGILGVGIVGAWVPLWIVVLLAIGLGVGLLGWFSKRSGAGGA